MLCATRNARRKEKSRLDEEKRRKKAANNKTHTRGFVWMGETLRRSLPVALLARQSLHNIKGNRCTDMWHLIIIMVILDYIKSPPRLSNEGARHSVAPNLWK